ncbi:MAG TPA: homocysteine S-methyltransferase family protein [Candidatus Baltobacteraceae bacterium]|nr:homocysteine S-methyltransferase family protein [Candidatus Baltobacteraceae bacterium]
MLTDGGIETRVIYEFGRALSDFAAFTLLDDAEGCRILEEIYRSYLDVAIESSLRIQLGTPTWRASQRWTSDVERVNHHAVELLLEAIDEHRHDTILAGVIGPASDGYDPSAALDAESAQAYHLEQAAALASAGVDLLYAPTFPSFQELLGVARAMAQTGVPYVLAPMLRDEGTMIDGTPLGEAIARIDEHTSPPPAHYMIGCLYPTHAANALRATRKTYPREVERVRGLKANASALSADELDRADEVESEPVKTFARDEILCAREFNLEILGGCCGTDEHHIAEIARAYTGGA